MKHTNKYNIGDELYCPDMTDKFIQKIKVTMISVSADGCTYSDGKIVVDESSVFLNRKDAYKDLMRDIENEMNMPENF